MSQFAAAFRAVLYTQRVLGAVPSNDPQRVQATHGASVICVDGVRTRYRGQRDQDLIMNIRRTAALAKAARCGNCGEYAAVAFDTLMLTGCPYSLEFAGYRDPSDHAFVIVGRPENSNSSQPNTWGRDAVICDAWAGTVVSAAQYWTRMPGYPQFVTAPVIDVRWPLPAGDHPRLRPTQFAA
jgi:hypothetical protein